MCGIWLCLSPARGQVIQQHGECIKLTENKSAFIRRGPDCQQSREVYIDPLWYLSVHSTVLHMRGDLVSQPIEHEDTGNILLWNGEVFSGIEIPEGENDGHIVIGLLASCKNDDELLNTFKRIQGPYAFVYIQKSSKKIWFGRDVFGRRSLVFYTNPLTKDIYLSSVVPSESETHFESCWKELTAAGIYRLQILDESKYDIACYSWAHNSMEPNTEINATIIESLSLYDFQPLNMTLPKEEDLVPLLDTATPLLLALDHLQVECTEFLERLQRAVHRRVGKHSYFCGSCREGGVCDDPHISIMFSGGIDSMMLAYLADKCVPRGQTIDLLNVAFETVSNRGSYDVPDRVTGRQALDELPASRKWNFVEIDVTKEELGNCRNERIANLIRPLDSVLDDSIGCAMWFASRGCGHINGTDGVKVPYTSKARVVLSGLGADEQLGGYSRHRSSFLENQFEGLLNELDKDVSRVSARNLGRDDRIISDHSKEARFPFLDEEFVSFVNQLPVQKKMDLRLPRGVGEKLILRACALKCGLHRTAELAKRAIQFGSRIAKCENRKEKGADHCERLLKPITSTES